MPADLHRQYQGESERYDGTILKYSENEATYTVTFGQMKVSIEGWNKELDSDGNGATETGYIAAHNAKYDSHPTIVIMTPPGHVPDDLCR